ncbi:hypothetical protein COLU111180_03810 [Cohnella lubricantis]|uniref:Lipoprotein n=1 Tax=Cohnella lubricantis TaxID=2163172 RepID=A0A841TE58_9BACL|nr:hypothetical protein [Cohnella lubricantis]MBB6676731.1 hypothetical protein [Cohnella lubricantis]MBP2117777.1 hypothetical protein [Cohnella lubricantis]
MTRRWLPLLTAAVLALQLAGCSAGGSGNRSDSAPSASSSEATMTASPTGVQEVPGSEPAPSGEVSAPEETNSPDPAPSSPAADEALLDAAHEVADALRDRDLPRLLDWISLDTGLRFSPYAHMDDGHDIVWLPHEIPSFKDPATFDWGVYDGSGDPIELTFRDYFEKFVYDEDFADAPSITANKLVSQGNVEFNVKDIYPDASFVEFHFPGADQNDGMDWKSLILVLTPSGQDWKLSAIVHSQWTI